MTNNSNDSWWERTPIQALSQGDLLPGCFVPRIPVDFDTMPSEGFELETQKVNLIVVTQGCDIDRKDIADILLCRVFTLQEFAASTPKYQNRKEFNAIVSGRFEALHMLKQPPDSVMYTEQLIVSFLQLHTLPKGYVERHASSLRHRWRLKSPYLEQFSHAFGRLFSRVALPTGSEIPRFA